MGFFLVVLRCLKIFGSFPALAHVSGFGFVEAILLGGHDRDVGNFLVVHHFSFGGCFCFRPIFFFDLDQSTSFFSRASCWCHRYRLFRLRDFLGVHLLRIFNILYLMKLVWRSKARTLGLMVGAKSPIEARINKNIYLRLSQFQWGPLFVFGRLYFIFPFL